MPYSSYDLNSPSQTQFANTGMYPPQSPYGPGIAYSPRPQLAPQSSSTAIPLQDFGADGLPPPPPVSESWRRIDRWAEEHYHELWDQLSYPATVPDVEELEQQLGVSLPRDVAESLYVHDGQERGGYPTGILFGVTLLDCEEILEEWNLWRSVAGRDDEALLSGGETAAQVQAILAKQSSRPEGAIKHRYAHPGWVPLGKDFQGNNIGVDLAPGPTGRWGQVILFGRDQDVKYVIARSWGSLLAGVADELDGGKWSIEEETGELRLRGAFDHEDHYFDVLKARLRRREKRRTMQSSDKRASVNGAGNAPRLMSPTASPAIGHKLARVSEEAESASASAGVSAASMLESKAESAARAQEATDTATTGLGLSMHSQESTEATAVTAATSVDGVQANATKGDDFEEVEMDGGEKVEETEQPVEPEVEVKTQEKAESVKDEKKPEETEEEVKVEDEETSADKNGQETAVVAEKLPETEDVKEVVA
ncbi:Cell wall assembly regulator [Saitoella coloradoensis]